MLYKILYVEYMYNMQNCN